MSGVLQTDCLHVLAHLQNKLGIMYEKKPCETHVGPYNTVILKFLKTNMNIQFVSGVYALCNAYIFKVIPMKTWICQALLCRNWQTSNHTPASNVWVHLFSQQILYSKSSLF